MSDLWVPPRASLWRPSRPDSRRSWKHASGATPSAPSYNSYLPTLGPSGPTIWYQMAESSGSTAIDSSGNNHTGTYQSGYSLASSPNPPMGGTPVDFSAPSGGITPNVSFIFSGSETAITYIIWYYRTDTTSGQNWNLISAGYPPPTITDAGFALWQTNGGTAELATAIDTSGSGYTLLTGSIGADNTWHMAAAVWTKTGTLDGTNNFILFRDGSELAGSVVTGSFTAASNSFVTLTGGWPSSGPYLGQACQMAMWDGYAVTLTELATLYGLA